VPDGDWQGLADRVAQYLGFTNIARKSSTHISRVHPHHIPQPPQPKVESKGERCSGRRQTHPQTVSNRSDVLPQISSNLCHRPYSLGWRVGGGWALSDTCGRPPRYAIFSHLPMVYSYVVLQAWRAHRRSSPKAAPRLRRTIRWRSTRRPWPLNRVCYIYSCSKIILLRLFTAPAGPSKDKGKGKAADAGSGSMQVDLQAIPF